MASKADLLKRIEALEAEVALLRARPVLGPIVTGPHYPYPAFPYGRPHIYCGSTAASLGSLGGVANVVSINSAA